MVGNIAWPHPKVVEIGSLLSTIGAGLQSLTGAPRLLQAISKDQIIPFLKPFETLSGSGEPVRALGITLVISEVAVLIGKYNSTSLNKIQKIQEKKVADQSLLIIQPKALYIGKLSLPADVIQFS